MIPAQFLKKISPKKKSTKKPFSLKKNAAFERKDAAMDVKQGISEDSPADKKLDRLMGVK